MIGVGAVTFILAGKDDVEKPTTSTVGVDLSSVTGLDIGVNTVVLIVASVRKTTGAANSASLGLKINGTQIKNNGTVFSTTNQVEQAIVWWLLAPRDANYQAGYGVVMRTGEAVTQMFTNDGVLPNAAITSVTLTGLVADALITLRTSYLKVYKLAEA